MVLAFPYIPGYLYVQGHRIYCDGVYSMYELCIMLRPVPGIH